MPIGAIAALPAAVLALLQADAEEAVTSARHLADWLNGALALRYGDRAAAARRAEGRDTGTVRFEDDDVTVIADLPKKVTWDQGRLATMAERIRAAGDNPAEYLEIAYRVPERRYGAWPAAMREGFAEARSETTGKPVFRLEARDR
jgi:hypothetical protein